MIYSNELEQHVLAGLIKYPDLFADIDTFIDENDFYEEDSIVNKTIFRIIRQLVYATEAIDPVIISERVNSLGISFEDNIKIGDYIQALSMRRVAKNQVLSSCKELKKLTVKREICASARDVEKRVKKMPSTATYTEIVTLADSVFNEKINVFESGQDKPTNIYEEMEDMIEELGNNPVTDFGPVGPHKKLHDMYGSLLRPGNITVVTDRSGVGKTQFCMDFCTKVSEQYDIPVLHFDNGEMSKEELIMRQCAALSGVPLHLCETGKWRTAGKEVCDKIRSVWPKIKKLKFYYQNVGGLSTDQMVALVKRFYYGKIGRGNQMILSFDYIKTSYGDGNSQMKEWEQIGVMVNSFKKCIQREILVDGDPIIPMITSVQTNRIGISQNRNSDSIVEDESVVSLSDRITQFCSHMFFLRPKTVDELENDMGFGSHKLINLKARHLGDDIYGAIEPVKMPDGTLKKNFVNLNFDNFGITEVGDLRDLVEHVEAGGEVFQDGDSVIPDLLS